MRQAFYIVPDISKTSGGPRTRISCFKSIFLKKGAVIFQDKSKKDVLRNKNIDFLYIESATNRISVADFFYLFILKFTSKKRIVFIRDVYIELFPEEYASLRAKITLIANKVSNFYLTWVATSLVFPTEEMGHSFFKKNVRFPKRKYTHLAPATLDVTTKKTLPEFTKKLGILYLGGLGYANSGYKLFLKFSEAYEKYYNFYILSGDTDLDQKTAGYPVILNKVPRTEIPSFISKHNIAFAFHTRPRNLYDDLTYPIKVFDFLSFQLPFISQKHIPLVLLLGNDYPLFASYENLEKIHLLIKGINKAKYEDIVDSLKEIAHKNTYEERYKRLHSL